MAPEESAMRAKKKPCKLCLRIRVFLILVGCVVAAKLIPSVVAVVAAKPMAMMAAAVIPLAADRTRFLHTRDRMCTCMTR